MPGQFNLPAEKWVTVGGWWGLFSWKKLMVEVNTDRSCRWRRIPVPAWGSFVGSKSVWLWNSVLQVKSPVDTTCVSYFL